MSSVAADLFWYPKYGDPTTVTTPDVMVVFGRHKGDRPSYKQWEEDGIAPQVAFEILSPSNTTAKRNETFKFYQRYGAEEYYEYDPATHALQIWTRNGKKLVPHEIVDGFVSPRMGIRFEVSGTSPMRLIRPDGTRFRSYLELVSDADAERERAAAALEQAAKLAAKLRELGVDPDSV